MKLLADAMLGRLAKWLRILGYDTAYVSDTDDFAVIRLARAEGRLILTRDHGLAERRGVETLLVESQLLEDQLRQVCASVDPPPDPRCSRCPVCNHALVEPDPEQIASNVPPYVRKRHQHFSWCSACDRVYWQGTHWQRMRALVDQLHDGFSSATMGAGRRDPGP